MFSLHRPGGKNNPRIHPHLMHNRRPPLRELLPLCSSRRDPNDFRLPPRLCLDKRSSRSAMPRNPPNRRTACQNHREKPAGKDRRHVHRREILAIKLLKHLCPSHQRKRPKARGLSNRFFPQKVPRAEKPHRKNDARLLCDHLRKSASGGAQGPGPAVQLWPAQVPGRHQCGRTWTELQHQQGRFYGNLQE